MARRTPLVQDALDEYLSTRQHLAPNTLLNDRSVLNAFVRHLGQLQIGHLTPQHVETYFLGANGIGARMNAQSANKVRQRIAGFLDFCARRGWNRRPLMENVRPRRVFQRERLQLSAAQLLDLLEVTEDPRDRGMLAVATNTGLRAGELTRIRIGDVNLAGGTLHVVISKSNMEDHMPISTELEGSCCRTCPQPVDRKPSTPRWPRSSLSSS
jgi:site-specific recombinase XerD